MNTRFLSLTAGVVGLSLAALANPVAVSAKTLAPMASQQTIATLPSSETQQLAQAVMDYLVVEDASDLTDEDLETLYSEGIVVIEEREVTDDELAQLEAEGNIITFEEELWDEDCGE
ncbi:MAG: hypothetical protein AAF171_15720 [Cyanobacteria bacterium P01_A01_bin.116]